jgi:hypothetical protein
MQLELFEKLDSLVIEPNLDPEDVAAVTEIHTTYLNIRKNIGEVLEFAKTFEKPLGFGEAHYPLKETVWKMERELHDLQRTVIHQLTGYFSKKYSLVLNTDFIDDLERDREEPYTLELFMEWLENENRQLNFVERARGQVISRFLKHLYRTTNFRTTKNTLTLEGYIGKESYYSSTPQLDQKTYGEFIEGLSLFEFGTPKASKKFDVVPRNVVEYQATYQTMQAKITGLAFYQNSNVKISFGDPTFVSEFISFFGLGSDKN